MANRARGRLVLVLAAALAAAASTSAGVGAALPAPGSASATATIRTTTLDTQGLRRLAGTRWLSGRYVTASGAAVHVSISPAYGSDPGAGQRWADFFAGLIHGSELSSLDAYVAPLTEVETICQGEAYGCYASNHLVTMGESHDGVTPQSVATHEYGHHVAAHRLNAPWVAIDWGTKRWSTYMHVCTRATGGSAFPGAEDENYPLNPGEAFAETYRVLNETQAGLPLTWPIVDNSFRPDQGALDAVREDVLQPWTGPTMQTIRGRFTRGRKTLTLKLSAPFDGSVSVQLSTGSDRLQLLSGDNRTVLGEGAWTQTGGKSIDYVECGQHSLEVRVTRLGAARSFTLRISFP
jgi:hypothetical protein